MRYLLDTNICIYALNRRPPEVLDRLRVEGPSGVGLSAITLVELRHGAERSAHPPRAHGKLDLFLGPMQILPFEDQAALDAGRIRAHLDRQGTPIGDLDSLIAAHARSRGLTLVTNDQRHFERVPHLRVESWVE